MCAVTDGDVTYCEQETCRRMSDRTAFCKLLKTSNMEGHCPILANAAALREVVARLRCGVSVR